jgi:hypothetical protein
MAPLKSFLIELTWSAQGGLAPYSVCSGLRMCPEDSVSVAPPRHIFHSILMFLAICPVFLGLALAGSISGKSGYSSIEMAKILHHVAWLGIFSEDLE